MGNRSLRFRKSFVRFMCRPSGKKNGIPPFFISSMHYRLCCQNTTRSISSIDSDSECICWDRTIMFSIMTVDRFSMFLTDTCHNLTHATGQLPPKALFSYGATTGICQVKKAFNTMLGGQNFNSSQDLRRQRSRTLHFLASSTSDREDPSQRDCQNGHSDNLTSEGPQ